MFLRKIQSKILRKIQICKQNVTQNTVYFVTQNTGFSGKCFAKYSDKLLRSVFAKYRLFAKYNKPY